MTLVLNDENQFLSQAIQLNPSDRCQTREEQDAKWGL